MKVKTRLSKEYIKANPQKTVRSVGGYIHSAHWIVRSIKEERLDMLKNAKFPYYHDGGGESAPVLEVVMITDKPAKKKVEKDTK